jgi:hypothetical protein
MFFENFHTHLSPELTNKRRINWGMNVIKKITPKKSQK